MRDPSFPLIRKNEKLCREITNSDFIDYLKGTVIQELVSRQLLLDFVIEDQELLPEEIDPVSYPFEWVADQLYDAGMLTLDIMEAIIPTGYELKDASAWNIIFKGSRALFCDHGSFSKISSHQWWGFGQFIRNFITPLIIEKKRGVRVSELFAIYRDGVPFEDLKKFGINIFDTGFAASLLYFFRGKDENNSDIRSTQGGTSMEKSIELRGYLIKYLRYLMKRLKPTIDKTTWFDYTSNRTHYSSSALQEKKKTVKKLINRIENISMAIDIGSNNGEFSQLLEKHFSKVVCLDIDHGAISTLYQDVEKDYYSFLINLENIIGSRGFMGSEFKNISERLQGSDLIIFLAIVHHLHISSSVPLNEITSSLSSLSPKYVIFEGVFFNDPMAELLAKKTNRDISYLNSDYYSETLSKNFEILETVKLEKETREIFFLRNRLH